MTVHPDIDHAAPFDWGRAAADYARYRDIYPQQVYDTLLELDLCTARQDVLDLGTGTGVLPRNMHRYGARFTGVDCSEGQIRQARRLSAQAGMEDIAYLVAPAEAVPLPGRSFDVITACQCHFYFDHSRMAAEAHRLLRPGGRMAAVYLAWLPGEDPVAGPSEALVLRHNPSWTGGGEYRRPIDLDPAYDLYFQVEARRLFDLRIPFTRESWAGRIRACRGIGASLSAEAAARFDREHRQLLARIAPERFTVLHYCAIAVLRRMD